MDLPKPWERHIPNAVAAAAVGMATASYTENCKFTKSTQQQVDHEIQARNLKNILVIRENIKKKNINLKEAAIWCERLGIPKKECLKPFYEKSKKDDGGNKGGSSKSDGGSKSGSSNTGVPSQGTQTNKVTTNSTENTKSLKTEIADPRDLCFLENQPIVLTENSNCYFNTDPSFLNNKITDTSFISTKIPDTFYNSLNNKTNLIAEIADTFDTSSNAETYLVAEAYDEFFNNLNTKTNLSQLNPIQLIESPNSNIPTPSEPWFHNSFFVGILASTIFLLGSLGFSWLKQKNPTIKKYFKSREDIFFESQFEIQKKFDLLLNEQKKTEKNLKSLNEIFKEKQLEIQRQLDLLIDEKNNYLEK